MILQRGALLGGQGEHLQGPAAPLFVPVVLGLGENLFALFDENDDVVGQIARQQLEQPAQQGRILVEVLPQFHGLHEVVINQFRFRGWSGGGRRR